MNCFILDKVDKTAIPYAVVKSYARIVGSSENDENYENYAIIAHDKDLPFLCTLGFKYCKDYKNTIYKDLNNINTRYFLRICASKYKCVLFTNDGAVFEKIGAKSFREYYKEKQDTDNIEEQKILALASDKKIYDLKDKGLTNEQIADILGLDSNSVKYRVVRYCKENGIDSTLSEKAKRNRKIIDLHRRGYSSASIAAVVGYSQSTCWQVLQDFRNFNII